MKHFSSISLTLAAAAATCVCAQDLNQTIVGCIEVGCPPSSTDTVNDDCRVADSSFPSVGLTRIPTKNKDLDGKLSWTKGFNVTDRGAAGGQEFHSSFYFGTAPDLDLSGTGACAVFLHGVEPSLSFDKVDKNLESAQGTCADAMGNDCVTALIDRAKKLVDGFGSNPPSSEEACARLQDDLDKNMDHACLSLTKGSWTDLTTAVLTGEGAPAAITGDKNASSTCWPVLPKQNQLALVSDQKTNGSDQEDVIQKATYAITPILTLFFPTGKNSVISEADASLSCVKVVGPSKASVDTASNGTQDHDSGVAKAFEHSQSGLFGFVMAVVAAVSLL
ncbi:hypothetical protein F5Y17DRAFT_359088 [Xylariaceae sp. FL0594]|nr:hypothetical protein F5Y17DRAFT_359088 [Xylariaceae sp. FL0594]